MFLTGWTDAGIGVEFGAAAWGQLVAVRAFAGFFVVAVAAYDVSALRAFGYAVLVFFTRAGVAYDVAANETVDHCGGHAVRQVEPGGRWHSVIHTYLCPLRVRVVRFAS